MSDQTPVASVEEPPKKFRVRWWLVALAVVGGAVALGLAYLASEEWLSAFGDLDDRKSAFWAGFGVNVASTLLLAAILVIFERTLLTEVGKEAERAVEKKVQSVRDEVDVLRTDVTDLNDLLQDRRDARAGRYSELANAVSTERSMESIRDLLAEATQRGAIPPARDDDGDVLENSGEITVRAGDASEAPFVLFRCFTAIGSRFLVAAHGLEDTYVWWSDNEPAGEVIDALAQKMVDRNAGAASRAIDGTALFNNLSAALHDALKARSGDPDAWIKNTPVLEVFADGWALTSKGVEVRGKGLVIGDFEFSHWSSSTRGAAHIVPAKIGPVPAGLDPDLWGLAAERGSRYFNAGPMGR